MKKLLAELIKAGLPRWLITALGVAFLLVLLRAAGLSVGRYADQAITELFVSLPIAKIMLVWLAVGGFFGSAVGFIGIRIAWLMGYPRTRETSFKVLVVTTPIMYMLTLFFYISNHMMLQS